MTTPTSLSRRRWISSGITACAYLVVTNGGDMGLADDKPQVHAHASVSLPDGTLRGGHVLEAVVWPTLEVFFTALPQALSKEKDPQTDLLPFELPKH